MTSHPGLRFDVEARAFLDLFQGRDTYEAYVGAALLADMRNHIVGYIKALSEANRGATQLPASNALSMMRRR